MPVAVRSAGRWRHPMDRSAVWVWDKADRAIEAEVNFVSFRICYNCTYLERCEIQEDIC